MRVYQSLVRSVKGESYEVFKRTVKREKYVPVIIAVLVVTEAFLFTFYGYHWLKTVRYLILSAFLVVLGFIDSKMNTDSQSASDYDACGKSHASDWRDRSRACMVEGMSEICIWRPWSWSGDFLLAAWFLSRKSIGMGDVKLAAVIGWYLGGSLIWFDLVVCLSLSAIFSIVQLLRKKLTMKDSIPLARFFSGTI